MGSFEEYVALAWPRLLRSAWLLTGDWHRAEDLLQTVLARSVPALVAPRRRRTRRVSALHARHHLPDVVAAAVA